MRIIAGNFKGKHIKIPPSFSSRPTTDFARESLFNILNNHYNLNEIRFLDLFSGSGAISFEMFSRGCEDISCVEINTSQAEFIKKIFEELDAGKVSVYNANAISYLEKVQQEYHIIFADPPYDTNDYNEIHRLVFDRNLLRPGGLLIMEHNKIHDFSALPHFLEHRKYGGVYFSIFEQAM
ncbi:MAG: 16S rRNA (guanine(966)-N(2))-methyltransferase RsmD [Candidatus Delongbacteria bacterium]|jgi:16S rRNA (guanine966-N2)-methyltransferase|nr:16S rRNA (guanine(966)-N(2))-methyltransferase RsmD [Candidatus Delongbacteria bacterium]